MTTKKTKDTIDCLRAQLSSCRERMKDPEIDSEYLDYLKKSEEKIIGNINSLQEKLN